MILISGRRARSSLLRSRQFVSMAHPRTKPIVYSVSAPQEYLPFAPISPLKQQKTQPRYRFDRETDSIGSGFFAEVFKGVDTVTQEIVALKVIDTLKCPKEVFQQELKVMSAIKKSVTGDHEGLGLHKDVLRQKGCSEVTFVMDYFNGGDMFDEVINNGPLSESDAQALMQRLCKPLKSLHDAGFVHRDVKLENLLLKSSADRKERLSTVTLTDYGYARQVSAKDTFSNPAGTYGYVAPEILSHKRYSTKGDVWSLGVVLFSAVAGYQPFPYKSNLSSKAKTEEIISVELEAIEHGMLESVWRQEMEKDSFADKSDEFKRFLRCLLEVDDSKRYSIDNILQDSWMKQTIAQEEGEEAKFIEQEF